MTRRAVIVCPGRGTYNAPELGTLAKLHADKTALLRQFDAMRVADGLETLTSLDSAERYSVAKHTRGDMASPLIYACSLFDSMSLGNDIAVVAVTGNSMGWYSALAVAGALSPENGFRLVDTMGRLMQESLIGGQTLYPVTDEDWKPNAAKKANLLALMAEIDARPEHRLGLSIDLGGVFVLAGNEAGLSAFEKSVPVVQERFPMRLHNHAAFHTDLQAPVAAQGRRQLGTLSIEQPKHPIIDGRGHIWWPGATSLEALWDYTLGHQVVETYDFVSAIRTAAREFAPDLFIILGPGNTLGGAVAQSLIASGWKNWRTKQDFLDQQSLSPAVVSMALEGQRAMVRG